jgi:branched-chain amino acid transport system substrate-binding protein
MYFHGVIDFGMKTNKTMGNIAIIYSDRGKFPRTVALGAAEHAERLGISQIDMLRYDPSDESFQSTINSTRIYNADLILGVGRQEDDIALAKTWVGANYPTHKIALIATPTQKFIQELGSLADGFLGPSQWEEVAVNEIDYGPTASTLGLTGSDYPKAQAYAAGLVAQRCVEQAGTLDNKLLYDTSSQLDFRTFYGRFKMDPVSHRQIGHQMVVVQWQSGEKTVVWPQESVIG